MAKKAVKKATRKATKPAKVAKKATGKKTSTAKMTAKPEAKGLPKNLSFKEPASNSEILGMISEATALSRKQVAMVFDSLNEIINGHVKRNAAGVCKVAGLMKIEVKRKPATKARKGINPFTGEEVMFKAKPARNVVKIRPLKKLKEMVV